MWQLYHCPNVFRYSENIQIWELDTGTKFDQPDQGEAALHYLETCTTLWCISLWRLIHHYSTIVRVPCNVIWLYIKDAHSHCDIANWLMLNEIFELHIFHLDVWNLNPVPQVGKKLVIDRLLVSEHFLTLTVTIIHKMLYLLWPNINDSN